MRRYNRTNVLTMIGIAAIFLTLAIEIVVGTRQSLQWEAFSQAHHCKLVSHKEPSTGYGVFGGKMGFYSTQGTDTFTCGGGYTEEREH